MAMPTQRIQMIAGTPIEVGPWRLLPSVMASTLSGGDDGPWGMRGVSLRPVSVVVDGPEGTRWLPIPDGMTEALSPMLVVGAGVAVVSVVLMVLIHLTRGRRSH